MKKRFLALLRRAPMSRVRLAVKLRKLGYLAIGWWAAGTGVALLEYFVLNQHHAWSAQLSFWQNWLFLMIKVAVGVLSIGVAEVFYFKDRFRLMPFGRALFIRISYYLLAIVLITGVIDLSAAFPHPAGMYPERFGHWLRFGLPANLIVWGPVVVATLLLLLIRDKYGHGIFSAFIRGHYHTPREEFRVFMFLDLNDSTTIAEKLGHVHYFNLLKSIFADVTYPILYHKGEVYQYVGDEVVISWKVRNALEDRNAVELFADIERVFQHRKVFYLREFGLVPTFKASLHYGEVTVGEIGVIKKDIVFTGDTLNTAARMRDLCRPLQSPLLVSDQLLDMMHLPTDEFSVEEIGELAVKGRMEPIHLWRVAKRRVPYLPDTPTKKSTN